MKKYFNIKGVYGVETIDELELIEWNTYGLLTPARKDFNRNK